MRGEIANSYGAKDFRYATYSAIKIARFATHREFERQGIGRNMLLKIFAIWIRLSKYSGCRIITVDSKPEAVGFYKKFDFHEAIIDKRKLKDQSTILKDQSTIPMYIDIHKELERTGKNTSFGTVSKASDNEYEPAAKDIQPNQISKGHMYVEFVEYVIDSSLEN